MFDYSPQQAGEHLAKRKRLKDFNRLIKCLTGLLSMIPSLCAPLPSLNMANALLDLMSSTACYDPEWEWPQNSKIKDVLKNEELVFEF